MPTAEKSTKKSTTADVQKGDVIDGAVVKGSLRRVRVLEVRPRSGSPEVLAVPVDHPGAARVFLYPGRRDGRWGDGSKLETDRCDKCGHVLRDADGRRLPKGSNRRAHHGRAVMKGARQ